MEHIFDNVCAELEYNADPVAFNKKLNGPSFIGQGCSKQVGSDCYAHYIVEKKQIGKKTIWGMSNAKSRFEHSWTDGCQICDGPVSWKATEWITSWGKHEDDSPKWWFCDENGNRCHGHKCTYSFRGAHAYQSPSF